MGCGMPLPILPWSTRGQGFPSVKELRLLQPIDPSTLEKETLRIYDVCDGCRRCFNLCPSFNTLLDRIDEYDGDVAKLARRITIASSMNATTANCVSITALTRRRINMGSTFRFDGGVEKRLASERGTSWRDWLLTRTDLLGRLNSTFRAVGQLGPRTGVGARTHAVGSGRAP